jgi:hypothetical protein
LEIGPLERVDARNETVEAIEHDELIVSGGEAGDNFHRTGCGIVAGITG